MKKCEKDAIGVFLADLYHHKSVKKKMHELKSCMAKEEVISIIDDLKGKGILNETETIYLYNKINGLYGK